MPRYTKCCLLLLFMFILSIGCNSGDNQLVNATPGKRTVEIQLNWIPDAQHGGFIAAQHFENSSINIKITPGGPGTPVIPKVAMGRCDFAVANADQVLLARAQGADIVAVFAAMQDSPRCIMVHKASGISSLNDLANVTLALGDGKAFAEYLKANVSLDGVRIVSYSGSVAKFLIDPNFAQQGYVFSEPLVAESQGGDPLPLMVSELGFNPYSSVLVTRRELLTKDPELVKNVVEAVRLGWQAFLDEPEPINEVIRGLNPEMDAQILAKSVGAIRTLCLPNESTRLGEMTIDRWQRLGEQLVELKLLPEPLPVAAEAFVNNPSP